MNIFDTTLTGIMYGCTYLFGMGVMLLGLGIISLWLFPDALVHIGIPIPIGQMIGAIPLSVILAVIAISLKRDGRQLFYE